MTVASEVPEADTAAQLRAALDKIASLELAMESNRRIGMAVGIVMAMHKVTGDAAFDLLVGLSKRTERKVLDVAEDIIESGTLLP